MSKKNSTLEVTSPSLQDRSTALLKWAKARGSNSKDLFLAVESAWDVNAVLDRVSAWSVATRKTHAQVWSTQDEEGTPLWMNALARHPGLLKSTEQVRMKGFWSALAWERKDQKGRDGLAYVMAGILSGVKTKDASAMWELACTKAGIVPVIKETELEKHEKALKRQQMLFLQMMLDSYRKNPEGWGDNGFIMSPDGESFEMSKLLELFQSMPKRAKFTQEKNPCGEILLPTASALDQLVDRKWNKYEEYSDERSHPYEGEWKSRLAQSVDVAMKWATTRVSHPVPTEVVFRRGEEISKPTWVEVKNLLPRLAQASLVSQNWEWINPDVEVKIEELEESVRKQPELVNWAGGHTLWKLMYPKSSPKEENVARMKAIKSWIEVGLDCEKWSEMLAPKFVESEKAGMYNVSPVKKWWAEEIQPLWERQRLKERVGLSGAGQREAPAL